MSVDPRWASWSCGWRANGRVSGRARGGGVRLSGQRQGITQSMATIVTLRWTGVSCRTPHLARAQAREQRSTFARCGGADDQLQAGLLAGRRGRYSWDGAAKWGEGTRAPIGGQVAAALLSGAGLRWDGRTVVASTGATYRPVTSYRPPELLSVCVALVLPAADRRRPPSPFLRDRALPLQIPHAAHRRSPGVRSG